MKRNTMNKIYPETIVVVRMYAGDYLKDNIGHEIINTFKTDCGESYIYVNPWGTVDKEHRNTKYILLVRLNNKEHCLEVLGYAGKLELLLSDQSLSAKSQKEIGVIDYDYQQSLIKENSITYGDIPINQLLSGQENNVFVTYKAGVYRFVNKQHKLYIVDDDNKADEQHIYIPNTHFSKQSLHMYFDNKNNSKAFDVMVKIIENPSYWEPTNTTEAVCTDNKPRDSVGILDVIGKADDELAYSNWIAYYLRNDKKLLEAFVKQILQINDIISDFQVRREYHDIDLWFENKEHIVVMENKIKSGINGVDPQRHDITSESVQSQLTKYMEFAEGESKGRKKHYYIVLPDYSYQDEELTPYLCDKKYKVLRYSILATFFASQSCALPFYEDFKKAISKHAVEYRNDLYEVMKERFIERVKSCQK